MSDTSATRDTDTAEAISRFVDAHFAEEAAFLAELVKVPSDNPPGDCARTRAARRRCSRRSV